MSLGLSQNRPLRLLAIAVGLCWLATVVLMSFYGDTRSLDQDEGFTVWIARPGWSHIARYIPLEPQPPLYFGSLSLWIRLGGESEPWLRALSGLVFLGGMAGIWALGRKVLAPRQLRWVLVAMATSKLFLWQAIEARMYGILEVEASLATLAYLGLITGRLSARAAGSTLFAISLAGIFTHYFYFFLLMAIALHYVFLSGRFRLPMFLGFAVAPGLIFAALWGPMWWSQVRSDRFDQEKVVNLPPTKHLSIVTEYFGNRGLAVALPGVVVLALVAIRKRSQILDFTGVTPRFRIVT